MAGAHDLSLAVVVVHGAHEVSALLRVGGVLAFLVMDEQAGSVIGWVVEEFGCAHGQFVGICDGDGVLAALFKQPAEPGCLGSVGSSSEREERASDEGEELAPRGSVLCRLLDGEGALTRGCR